MFILQFSEHSHDDTLEAGDTQADARSVHTSGSIKFANSSMHKMSREGFMVKRCPRCVSSLHFVEFVTELSSEASSIHLSSASTSEQSTPAEDMTPDPVVSAVYMLKEEDFPTDVITHRKLQPEDPYQSVDYSQNCKGTLLRYIVVLCIFVFAASITSYIVTTTWSCSSRILLEIVMLFSLTSVVTFVIILPATYFFLALITKC